MKVNGYVVTINLVDYPDLLKRVERSQELVTEERKAGRSSAYVQHYLNNQKKSVRAWVRTLHEDGCRINGHSLGLSDIDDVAKHGLNRPWFNMKYNPAWFLLRECKLCCSQET